MTISILSQSSVDSLRSHVQKGSDILSENYLDLLDKYQLHEIEVDIEFDNNHKLLLPKGKTQETNNDRQNCLLISKALSNLTDLEATDERLWVTLSLREFKDYSIARWPINNIDQQEKATKHTLNHWFAKTTRDLMRNNAISRLWWYHCLCSRVEGRNVEQTLEMLFFDSDFRSTLLERNSSSSVTEVVATILEITYEYEKKGIKYNRDKFRSFMKSLNFLAGRSRLATLNKKQLKDKLTPLYLKAYE